MLEPCTKVTQAVDSPKESKPVLPKSTPVTPISPGPPT